MHLQTIFSLALAVISATLAAADDKYVFAHFIAGNAAGMSPSDWASDIAMAKAAKIDGFAMNIASGDGNTGLVLSNAYSAAEAAGGFKLFLSFDYLSMGAWSAGAATNLINQYKSSSAQFQYHGKPFVSTFEGVNNIGDWDGIKASTGCFFVPAWTSLGPQGFSSHLNTADGALSWDAWPLGAEDKSADGDAAWQSMLGSKPFMMPVSPWFYTNLPNWNKNWLWRGDDLWHDRWTQAIELQPAMVELITWNDYGENHYIGPIHNSGIPSGADYVNNMPHEAWLNNLPHYIDAYKSGNTTAITDASERITYWYKLNPGTSGSDGGTTGNNPAQGQPVVAPQLVSQDKVFVTVYVTQPSDVNIQIGSGSTTNLRATTSGLNHLSVPFNGQTGAVNIAVSRNGQMVVSTTGPEITTNCNKGMVNWNAYVGSSS